MLSLVVFWRFFPPLLIRTKHAGFPAALFRPIFFSSATYWSMSTVKKSLLPFPPSTKRRLSTMSIGAFSSVPSRLLILVQRSWHWIKLFYTHIKSAVIINGWTSSFFQPSRVCAEVVHCLLLYVISTEVLAVSIRMSPRITGVQLPNSLEQFKCSGYADDTTVAATSDASIEETFTIYGQFERASGVRLNRGKSKVGARHCQT